jgi:hypothetical protein
VIFLRAASVLLPSPLPRLPIFVPSLNLALSTTTITLVSGASPNVPLARARQSQTHQIVRRGATRATRRQSATVAASASKYLRSWLRVLSSTHSALPRESLCVREGRRSCSPLTSAPRRHCERIPALSCKDCAARKSLDETVRSAQSSF